jgi:hypothetical protein
MKARGTWVRVGEAVQPAAAPRLSRTPGRAPREGIVPGEHSQDILRELDALGIGVGEPSASAVSTASSASAASAVTAASKT